MPKSNGSNRNNLGQFVKGNTASVGKGRPKGSTSIADILRRIGDEAGTPDGTMTKNEVVWRKVYQYAVEGKAWAVQFIADRTEGKALERISVEDFKTPWEIMNEVIEQGERKDDDEELVDSDMDSDGSRDTGGADTTSASGDD